MTLRSRATHQDDGTIVVKGFVPAPVWAVVCKHSETFKLTPIQSWGLFLGEISARIEAGNTDIFGPTYQQVIREMRLNNELGRNNMPPIDYTKLHRNDRVKSGFEGVYVTGDGFRAVGPGAKYIGQFQSADLAAWARYVYYTKNGLPYGDLEDKQKVLLKEIEGHRKRHAGFGKLTDKQLVDLVDNDNLLGGLPSLTQQILDAGLVFGGVDGSKEQTPVYADDGKEVDAVDRTTPEQREAFKAFVERQKLESGK